MDPSNGRSRGGNPGSEPSTSPTTTTVAAPTVNDVDPLRVIAAALVDIAANLQRMETRDGLRFNEECKRWRR